VLTDTALKNLRPKTKAYKSTDRDGMYVYVSTGGAISFRYDYRFNGRRETMTIGRYGRAGLTLAQARERLIEVKKAIADGVSPAVEKQRAKRRLKEAHDFAQVAQGWMDRAPMADSTRDMRRAIFNRDILPKWKNRLLSEITPDDLRAHCKAIVDREAPATAIHVRDIVKQIYGWAILHGEKIDNPADDVGPASIATFRPRDRSLTPAEIRIMLMLLGEVATPADHQARPQVHPAQHGSKERTSGRGMDRGGFRECGLVDPGRAHEALTPPQRLPLHPDARHPGRPEDLRRELEIHPAVAL
jgi:hypothetical protein